MSEFYIKINVIPTKEDGGVVLEYGVEVETNLSDPDLTKVMSDIVEDMKNEAS